MKDILLYPEYNDAYLMYQYYKYFYIEVFLWVKFECHIMIMEESV